MKLKVLFFLLSICFFNAHAQTQQESFDYGSVENHKYTNNFFAFEMLVPADWTVLSKEQADKMTEQGKKAIAGDNAQLKYSLDAAEIRIANLLSMSRTDSSAEGKLKPSCLVMSENIMHIPSISVGSDYLFEVRRSIEQSQIKYDYIDEDFKKEKINGTVFYKMNTAIFYNNVNIKQVYYSTLIKGFAFNVIITYITNEQKQALLDVLSTMKFVKK